MKNKIQTKFSAQGGPASGWKETEIGAIPEEWDVADIGNILSLEYGKALKDENRIVGEIPVYGSNGVVGYHNQKLVDGPGVIVGRKGSAGEVIFSKKDFFPIDTTYFVKTNLDNKYVYYLLKNTDIKQLVSSSAVPGLNRNDVYSQQIGIPKAENEQKQIAEILSSLDDKIELNRRINANLEKIASSLFRHWFVDFEFPTHPSPPLSGRETGTGMPVNFSSFDFPPDKGELLTFFPPDKGELEGVGEQEKLLFIPYNSKLKELARENRKNPTIAERKMWKILSGKQFENLKFNRQKPLENFIADFYCASLKFVIEIDGDSHDEKQEYDQLRSDILKEKYGIEVVRYANNEIMNNIEGVYDDLVEKIKIRVSNTTHPNPPTHTSPPLSGRGAETEMGMRTGMGKGYRSNGGKMIDSELGEIPEGWKVEPISSFGNVVCGKTPSKSVKEYFDGNIPFIKIPDMHGNIFVIKAVDSLAEAGMDSQKNKTISAGSICVSCIATVGLVSMTIKDSQTNQQINSIIPVKNIYQFYLYYAMKNLEGVLQRIGSSGSATLNVNTKSFSSINILSPDITILGLFDNIIRPIFDQIKLNMEESLVLSETRDSLLPRLMNGKIRVKI